MIPIIYPSNETQFQNNGLGRLPDCISCRVTEERNGVYELELVYPITGHNYDLIQIGRIIYTTHDATKTPQPFDIYKRSVPIDGHVTFSAHHISYRLNGMVVTPFTVTGAAGAALAALGSHSITSCPFTFSSDRTTSLTYTVSKPDTIRRLLGGVEGSILDVYGGGDYTFNKFNVTFGTRGTDNGVTIRYGKQMTDIDAEHSTEGTYNAVVPFWSNDTTMVTLPEWYVSNGTPEALAVLDLSSEWQEAPTVADLRAKAQDRLAKGKPWEPDENIEVSFVVQPEDYEGIENLQRVVLCDTVTVAYPAAGVSAKIRVIKTEYNPLTERYISVELGTPQTSLAQTITEKAVSDTLKNTITAGFMTQAIQTATDLIAGGLGGHVVIGRNADGEPEEILIMDTDDVQTAVNVIRMNRAGIGFSTDGYDGPFTSAWTIDGTFNTAFIQVNALSVLSANAGTITAGVLQSEDYSPPASGSDYASDGMIIDLNNKVIRTPKTAILSDGSIYSSSVDLEGKITATSGSIGPWTISSSAIYNGRGSIYSAENGVCISLNGIGGQTNDGKYTLTPSGTLTLTDQTAADEQGSTSAFITLEKPSKNESAHLSSFGLYVYRSNSQTDYYTASIGIAQNGNTNILLRGTDSTIGFSNPTGSETIYLSFSDSDVYQAPSSIALTGNQGNEYFIAPNIKATSGLYIGTASVANAVTNITRSGTTFTATRLDGTTFTFTQQDNNTTYTAGTGLTLSGTQFNLSDNELAYRQYAKTVSTDFNGITAPGIYVLDGTTMTNAPSGYTWSKLIVLMEGGWGQQIVSGNNFIYQRGFTGSPGAWSAWRRVDTLVKGDAETTYRGGDVNLTPANIGALALTGGTLTGTLILNNNIYIYSKDSGGTSRVLVALTDMDGFCYGYGSKAGSVGVSYFDGHVVYIRSNGAINMQCASASINAALTVTGTITGYDYSGSSHVMVGSASDASHRVGYLYHQNPTTVRVYGQAGGSGYTTYTTLTGSSSSDIRLKRNVADTEIADALGIINQIEMRSFDWLPGWRDYTHQPIGMIADQIEKLDNHLVIGGGYDPDGEPNYKVIDDHYLSCYLTKGIQELCAEIEQLKERIRRLEAA